MEEKDISELIEKDPSEEVIAWLQQMMEEHFRIDSNQPEEYK